MHCITVYENVGNPGHSVRGLRNHISFAMQIVVRKSHLKSSGPNRGHRGVCVAMGPHGGPMGPMGGPHGPTMGPMGPSGGPVVSLEPNMLQGYAKALSIRAPDMLQGYAKAPSTM